MLQFFLVLDWFPDFLLKSILKSYKNKELTCEYNLSLAYSIVLSINLWGIMIKRKANIVFSKKMNILSQGKVNGKCQKGKNINFDYQLR